MTVEIEKRLLEFFDAENRRDWEAYEKHLSDDIEWTIYGPSGRRIIKGKSSYVTTMRDAYAKVTSTFHVLSIAASGETGIVFAELEIDSRRSVDVFEFRNGLIFREREYYDDTYWLAEIQNIVVNNERWTVKDTSRNVTSGIGKRPR